MSELVALNRYAHDFAAAMWVCGSFLIWLSCREIRRSTLPAEAARSLAHLASRLVWLTIPSLVVTLVSGGVRAAAYVSYEYTGEITGRLIAMLAVKHVVYAAVVTWGIWVHVASRRLRRRIEADRQAQAPAEPDEE